MNEINVYRVESAGSEAIYMVIAKTDIAKNELIEEIINCKKYKVIHYPRNRIPHINEIRQACDKMMKEETSNS